MSQDCGTPQRPHQIDTRSSADGARPAEVPDLASAIVNTVHEALLLLDESFQVRLSNDSFQRLFQVSPAAILGKSIFDLGNKQWDIPELHRLLEAVLPGELEIKDFEVSLSFPGIGERTMLLNARIVHLTPPSHLLLLAIEDITERSAAAKEILESEARFRAIVKASSDVIYRMSPDWREMRYLAGRDFIADTSTPRLDWWQHYILPEDQAEVERVIQDAIQNHKVFELEHRVRRIDGTIGWIFSRAVPMFDARGGISEWIGTAKDITRRKTAEDVLRESEEKYRSLYDSMAEGFAIIELLHDEAGKPIDIRYLELNRGFEIQTGLSRERLLGLKLSEVFTESDRVRWLPRYSHVVETGETASFEEYVELLDKWYEVNAYHRGGNRIALFYRNVTARKHAEAVLYDRDEHLRSILNAATDAIISIDGRGIITSINSATERMFGYQRDELLGNNVKIIMPEPFCTEHDEYIRRYQKTGTPHVIGIGREAIAKRKDGSTFPIDLAVSEMDHLNQFTGIIRDISERKNLQRDILAIADEEQRRIRQDLHDSVQQELAAVGLVAQTLLRLVERSEDSLPKSFSEQCVGFVKKLASGISRAHQEVRDISRGQVSFPLSCDALIEALQELAIRTDELAGVSCAFACDVPVKQLNSAAATHLYRIAQEAVTNALKHSQPEHILIKLTVDSSQCSLQVADDGKGFDVGLPSEGMGIKTMRYRAGLLGGSLAITPVANGGTLINCRLPRYGNTNEKQ
jgi:PAS domain S-box-containing protein